MSRSLTQPLQPRNIIPKAEDSNPQTSIIEIFPEPIDLRGFPSAIDSRETYDLHSTAFAHSSHLRSPIRYYGSP
jgi:hypothetical protein